MNHEIPYATVIAQAKASAIPTAEYLRAAFSDVFCDAYVEITPRRTNIVVFTVGTFDYIFDDYASLEATGEVEKDTISDSRLVAAIGTSSPRAAARDDARLRGWVGRTEQRYGKAWDKGHFIAHSIGGAVDGIEANVFCQLRSVNRGWSDAGRAYRAMETYCAVNAGVLCFSRPIYHDSSATPAHIEFGILRTDAELWVQRFENIEPSTRVRISRVRLSR